MRVEAVIEEKIRGPGVGLEPPADACAHQGARLLDARRKQAPGAVILEASAEQANAIGQQGRRQRVARIADHRPTIEAEADRL